MKRFLKILAGMFAFLFLVQSFMLVHIRTITPVIPDAEEILAALDVEDGPVALSYAITSAQETPLGKIAYPGFILQWQDGRSFLMDSGMDPAGAKKFGKPIALVSGSPVETHGSIPDLLGKDTENIKGIAFSHLHEDHVQGITDICSILKNEAVIFQTEDQAAIHNLHTLKGQSAINKSECTKAEPFSGELFYPVPGFPGLIVMPAAGHTPGSSIYLARVGEHNWVFSGDITNFKKAISENKPKGFMYSYMLVPEATKVLEQLRLWLDELDKRSDVTVFPAHDAGYLESIGVGHEKIVPMQSKQAQ